MKPHSTPASSEFATATRFMSIEKEREAAFPTGAPLVTSSGAGGAPAWMCQTGFPSLVLAFLEEGQIIVDVARNHVEEQPLRLSRPVVHEERETFRRAVGEPVVDRQAVSQ